MLTWEKTDTRRQARSEEKEHGPERRFAARAEELAGTREFVRNRSLAAGCDADAETGPVLICRGMEEFLSHVR